MKRKINIEKSGIGLDDSLHSEFVDMMSEYNTAIKVKYGEGTFHRLFWQQQQQSLLTSPTQRRWHPMFIRWCLHLKMTSSAAYDSLRGILKLPCGRTLRDYTRWIRAGVGLQTEVMEQLRNEVEINSMQEWQKYVGVVFDEVKIKEGIVYDKESCSVMGFVDLGSVSNAFLNYERSMKGNDHVTHSVATHMLVFMVRGIFIRLNFPYAQYPTSDVSAGLLYPIVWEVIRSLECAGLKVVSLTGDKAAANRRFFSMHQSPDSNLCYKVPNPYSVEERSIYFISDVPHLIKTTRNCWSNSFGQYISYLMSLI